jgi:uncharacterized protein YodC (DUF2158 family)
MKIGDIVSLVSGGPKMTIQSVRKAPFGKQLITCVWFEKNKLAQAVFDIGALRKAAPEATSKTSECS